MKFTARCKMHNCDLKLRFDGQVFVEEAETGFRIRLVSFYCPEGGASWRFQSCDGQWQVLPETTRAEWFKTHKEFVRQQLMEDAEAIEEPSNKVDGGNSLERGAPQGHRHSDKEF